MISYTHAVMGGSSRAKVKGFLGVGVRVRVRVKAIFRGWR